MRQRTSGVDAEKLGRVQTDGRNVDQALGILSGEGAHQKVKRVEEELPVPREVFQQVPSRQAAPGAIPTYYGRPVLKEPVWAPTIAAYFYVGGAAGCASALGAAGLALGGERFRGLARACRWIAAAGDNLSAALLIYDLGRPTRFLNMMRVFRPTSPMNLGTWLLAGSGAFNTAALLFGGGRGALARLGTLADYAGGLLGLPLAGYTAVLISNTAVPVWSGGRRSMPALFVGSGMASAASLLDFFPLDPAGEALARRMGMVGKGVELAAGFALEREVGRSGQAVRPLKRGLSGALWTAARACTAASLLLAMLPGRQRWKRLATGALGTVGAMATRLAIYQAGKASARDPRATFAQQREGLGAAEITGRSAVAGPGGQPAVFALPVVS